MAAGSRSRSAILAGLLVGLVNGLVTTFFRINSLIATLAMAFVVAGIASLITGQPRRPLQPPRVRQPRADRRAHGEDVDLADVVAVIVLGIILAWTTVGRYMYAAGGNRRGGPASPACASTWCACSRSC